MHTVATQKWVGRDFSDSQFSAGESRPFDSLFISRNFPLFLPSVKSSPDPAIAERPPQFLHFFISFLCGPSPNLRLCVCNKNSLLTIIADMANKIDEPSCRFFSLGANPSSPADGKSNPSTFKCSTSGAATSSFF